LQLGCRKGAKRLKGDEKCDAGGIAPNEIRRVVGGDRRRAGDPPPSASALSISAIVMMVMVVMVMVMIRPGHEPPHHAVMVMMVVMMILRHFHAIARSCRLDRLRRGLRLNRSQNRPSVRDRGEKIPERPRLEDLA
jgi:hypothetical protein